MTRELSRVALTDVLSGGNPGPTVVHYMHLWNYQTTLCDQYEDGRVAHHRTPMEVDCMTCLVHANRYTQSEELWFDEDQQ